ncbi:MAG: diaminopimelate epimerase [Candidatus Neomarinimicrobiota bacterium]|jgi:diaminopimelate epimerase|nr:diaminopimelate epimerase [Candidatus Neomarinimicrobiota bacterium]MDX9780025.1 diaminopimelate epimerase [bacterium]
MRIAFSKYHGAGNDFILIDDRDLYFPETDAALIVRLCDRHFGIGADGLMLLRDSARADFAMLYFNSDGHPGTMCGNGGRCILAFARDLGRLEGKGPFSFEAADGVHQAFFTEKYRVRLKMGNVDNVREQLKGFRINTGSIHHVEYVDKLADVDVITLGKRIRHDPAYAGDKGCNVNFIEIRRDGSIGIRTYERGVENETLACGTGSVAAAIVRHYGGCKEMHYRIMAQGGELRVDFHYDKGVYREVYLEGPAIPVFHGVIET